MDCSFGMWQPPCSPGAKPPSVPLVSLELDKFCAQEITERFFLCGVVLVMVVLARKFSVSLPPDVPWKTHVFTIHISGPVVLKVPTHFFEMSDHA